MFAVTLAAVPYAPYSPWPLPDVELGGRVLRRTAPSSASASPADSEKLPSLDDTMIVPYTGLSPATRPVNAWILSDAVGRVPVKRKNPRSPRTGRR